MKIARKSLFGAVLFALICVFSEASSGPADLYLERKLRDSSKEITTLDFSGDSKLAAYANARGEVFVINIETGGDPERFIPHKKKVTVIRFSPGGRFLASASEDKRVCVLDLENGDLSELEKSKGKIAALCFSPDGRLLAAGGERENIYIWEMPSGQFRAKLEGHGDDIIEAAFDDPGTGIVSIGKDGEMILWDVSSAKLLRRYKLEARTIANSGIDITSARISGDRLFAAVGIDEHILEKGGRRMMFKYHIAFFDISKGVLLKILEESKHKIEDFALYPGNCYAAYDNSTLQNPSLALRNIETGAVDLSYSMDARCRRLAFSPDGAWLAGAVDRSGDDDSPHLYLWEVEYDMPASGCFVGRVRLTSTADPVIGAGPVKVAAVLPFAATGAEMEAGKAAAHFLESKLIECPYLKLVERARIDDVLTELQFQQSDLVDKTKAVKLGKLLGAAYIISGDVDRVGADLVVSAKVIDVNTAEILGIKEVHCGQCGLDDIYDAIDILAPALVEF